MEMITRATVSEVSDSLEYVISDGSVDRHNSIIESSGWDLAAFKRNPIALFNHDKNFIVGKWHDIRVESGRLLGRLELLPKGVSQRLDEIRAAVEAGVLRAVSVGFKPKPGGVRAEEKILRYTDQELLEASLVSVGSNKNALHLARGIDLSPTAASIVFGENAEEAMEVLSRSHSGENAEPIKPNISQGLRKMTTATPLSERIEAAQARELEYRDQLTQHLAQFDGQDMDEEARATADELNLKIEGAQKTKEALQRSEANLAATSQVRHVDSPSIVPSSRPYAVPAEKIQPADRVMRSLVAMVAGHASRKPAQQVLIERYGHDGKTDEGTRIVFDTLTRAATAPATTTTSGWASQLVETSIQGFMDLLLPASVYPGLSSRGLRLSFGRSGVISVPTRASTPTIAGSFVLEGSPIPVRQGAFSATTYTPKKMAVISTWTREIGEHSTPAIEGLIRNAIQEDTSVALDTVLLDATAASTTRPAGLRNGVTVTTATAGGGFDALVTDMKNLVGALITGSNGNLRRPVWIMNPIQALSISVIQNAGGDFPFAAEINQNRFQGYPVILSSTVTAAMVFLVDGADFVAIEGGAPRFDVSDQATLHMEDTTPLAIGTAGSPNTVAAPVRSLFQTDSVALRMIMDVNWGMQRTGTVAWTQSVTW